LKATTAHAREFGLITSLSFVYLAISIGVALQVGGANWDIIWHGIVNVESFFTPPHTVIYSGVALAIIAVLIGIIKSIRSNNRYYRLLLQQQVQQQQQQQQEKRSFFSSPKLLLSYIPFPLKLAAVGSLIELFSGRFDYWWHSNFGFDGLLSPPHFLLVVGMLMSILGALIGIYKLKKLRMSIADTTLEVEWRKKGSRSNSSRFINISFLFAYGIFWMAAVNMVFMFTLPYSKGQYFDFNPNPFTAIVVASLLIPLISGMIFYTAIRITTTITPDALQRLPFMFTLITAFFMVIHSTATILSNDYFVGLYPLYLLNIIPALTADIVVLQYSRKRTATDTSTHRSVIIVAPAIVSMFFITLFFPWSVNVYKTYFGIHLNTFGSVNIFEQLLWTIIIPIIIPLAALMSIAGSYIMYKLMDTAKVQKIIFNLNK
jgi:hypothetical protein